MASRALVGLALLVAGQAQARVDPTLTQSGLGPRPNILILLDTSGSLAGVAGTPFAPASEVGLDCEHGENCRPGGLLGMCHASKRVCLSSLDCRSGHCLSDERSLCTRDSDCAQELGRCARTAGSCLGDVDCPATDPCPAQTGRCSADARQTCTSDQECSISMRCQASGDLCRESSDCPLFSTSLCQGGPHARQVCHGPADCPAGVCGPAPANPCTGTPNLCRFPREPCLANTCVSAPANTCQPPASALDTCVPTPSGTPGPLRMCQDSHRLCTRDEDCGGRDTCGPATSRAMVLKRALARWVMDNHDRANFGLMTFYQDGYFPYGPSEIANSETVPVFLAEGQLRRLGCYSWDANDGTGGPSVTCALDGQVAILRGTADSRYRVSPGHGQGEIETDYCGENGEMPNGGGMGAYLGSTYLVRHTRAASVESQGLVRDRYEGHDISLGGRSYGYFSPRNDYYNGGPLPPFTPADCRDSCGASCGGRWDARLAPFLDTSDRPDKAWAAAQAITSRLNDAAHGGLLGLWGTPIGCALDNDASPTPFASAFHYMSALKRGRRGSDLVVAPDPVACRRNVLLLLTDGAPNGPGDVDDTGRSLCAEPACAADDPVSAGCRCRSVRAARRLQRELGVTVQVVGYSVDAIQGEAAAANHNLAKAGGSERAWLVAHSADLERALRAILAKTAGQGDAWPGSLTYAGQDRILVTRTTLPDWQGRASAYAISDKPTQPLWDALDNLQTAGAWKKRQVFTWNGSKLVKIQVDDASGDIRNRDELVAVGFGANTDEAARVARWALGDPNSGNPAPLGALAHSRPVVVGAPADSSLPGGHAHYLRHARRPGLVYVGASDQMVHAFFLQPTRMGGVDHPAGSEAFAFIPPDLLPRLRQIALQGGQPAAPRQHIFGVAGSPQVLDLCIAGCADEKTAEWRTLLAVSEGAGGPHAFALDITNPTGGKGPPFTVAWHTGYGAAARAPLPPWNDSSAAPARVFNPTPELDDYRLVLAAGSGIGTQSRSNLTSLRARDGSLIQRTPLSPNLACAQEYAVVTDVAVAHEGEHDELTVAGYFGDTAGQLWRISHAGGLSVLADFTCDQPLHFSPSVVRQMRQPGASADQDITLVQVTNSRRDPATALKPASQLIFLKQVVDRDRQGRVTGSHSDVRWGQAGRLVLTVGGQGMCAQIRRGHGGVSCEQPLPPSARPLSKPLTFPRARGFGVATVWQASASGPCASGPTTLTVHQVEADKVTQIAAVALKGPASAIAIGARLFVLDGELQEIALDE